MAFQINDPEEIDWAYFWAKKLEAKKDRSKDWNKAAPNFGKSAKRDDYHTKLIERIDVNKEYTILDLGCGDGTITIPLAKRAKSVTGVDSAHKMLEILNEKAQKEDMNNSDGLYTDRYIKIEDKENNTYTYELSAECEQKSCTLTATLTINPEGKFDEIKGYADELAKESMDENITFRG